MPSKRPTRIKVKRLALCIGIEGYDHFSPLPAAPNDALTIAEHLADPHVGGFDRVLVLTDRFVGDLKPGQKPNLTTDTKPVNSDRIQEALTQVFERFAFEKDSDSLLTFFFAGHAAPDQADNLYLFGKNGALTSRKTINIGTGFNLNAAFTDYLAAQDGPSNTIILLDACHAGTARKLAGQLTAFMGGNSPRGDKGLQQIYLIGGAQADQTANDNREHGYFTNCLLESFGQHTPSGWISMSRIQEYVADNLKRVSYGSTQQIEGFNSFGKNIRLVQRAFVWFFVVSLSL